MDFEENILRILTVEEVAFMPELSEFNLVGITEDDARRISKKNNLRVARGKLSTDETIFRFQHR